MFRSLQVYSSLLGFLALCTVTALAAEGPQRFKQVQAWEATFEVRFDLDAEGRTYEEFEGTKSVSGSFRVGEPFEDYGITWSGSGRATVTTDSGQETAVEMEECFVGILMDEGSFSAKFGDVAVEYEYSDGSSTEWKVGHLELITSELPLPAEDLVLSYDGPVKLGRDDEEIMMKFEIRPVS